MRPRSLAVLHMVISALAELGEESDHSGYTGIYVVLAGISMYYLLQHRQHTKGQYVLIAYTCAMFTVSTIYFCSAAKWSEIEFVESTVNPALFASSLSSPIAIAKDTASVVNIWLADSLIVCSISILVV